MSKVSICEQKNLSSKNGGKGVILEPLPPPHIVDKSVCKSKDGKKKKQTQHKYWFFTFNNYTSEQSEHFEHIFSYECEWYIFQEEKGKDGTPHLQGTICLKQRQRLNQLKVFNPKVHWEPTKSISSSKVYCTKYDTRAGKIYSKGVTIPCQVEVDEPFGWQLEVLDIINTKPDKRTIHWFWEPNGGVGKSTLCKYLAVKHDAIMVSGKSDNMFHAISKAKNKKIILVDCPRSCQGFMNYGGIEQIKNGHVFSGKYDSEQLLFNNPHVIVFSNEEPQEGKWSSDRCHVHEIRI